MRLAVISALVASAFAQTSPATTPVLKAATHHAMQYWLSLPEGWRASRKWPIVITISGGRKNFQETEEIYVKARKQLPFILVSPAILSNGGSDFRHMAEYNYASSVWDDVEKNGFCGFDLAGIDAVIADVRAQYHGDQVYFTGHSAGGHLTWMMVLLRPDRIAAAAPSAGNFTNRCIDDASKISTSAARTRLPVREFIGEVDEHRSGLEDQFQKAKALAAAHGYQNISFEVVKGEHHVPLAEPVLRWFYTLLPAGER